MQNIGYLVLCTDINLPHIGKRCFKIPELVDNSYFTKPHPPSPNYPELELAGTILSLVEFIDPEIKDKEFTKQLTLIANNYIEKVRAALPEGVELSRKAQALEKAA